MRVAILAQHGHDHHQRLVRLFKGFETFVFERCAGPCGHTQAEVGDEEENVVVYCIRSLRLLALVGAWPFDLDEEETSDDEEYSSNKGNKGSDDGSDEAGAQGTDPFMFRSVPCLFCHEMALNPKLEGEKTSVSVVRYGTHSYGYRCGRCQKISWITGAPPAEFEEESRDHSEEEPAAATTDTSSPGRLGGWAKFFGF